MHTITREEENLLKTVRNNPNLARCLFEMIEIAGENLGNIELADDAEEAVVQGIKKTGKELLKLWIEKKEKQLSDQAKLEKNTRLHEKKTSNGIQP